jgi:hypothetical protein
MLAELQEADDEERRIKEAKAAANRKKLELERQVRLTMFGLLC